MIIIKMIQMIMHVSDSNTDDHRRNNYNDTKIIRITQVVHSFDSIIVMITKVPGVK